MQDEAASGAASIGDVKHSYATADHGGWVVLDGRAVSSLTDGQKLAAAYLGWSTSIPDTRGLMPVAASALLSAGSTGGASKIARSALPNVTLSGSVDSTSITHSHASGTLVNSAIGSHSHTISLTTSAAGSHNHSYNMSNGATAVDGSASTASVSAINTSANTGAVADHTHTVSGSTATAAITSPTISGSTADNTASHSHAFTTPSLNGGVTQTDHLPPYVARTEFVYLGS